ncbi:ABC transporter permease subunit [Embleya sp. NPDC005575]|uniref:ABC transporter permease subunit n=1 Tax=Embleya sp. NPDC005575 TaxID=3156892 RepID=UPI0033AB0D14
MVTRELESGTHRLVWNQSVTRARRLAVKLAVITVATLVVTGLFSALPTWAARPYDRLQGTRFTPLVFDARNLVPLGYAVFAFALGTTIGLLIRRTLPAMAVTLVLFAVVQVVMPYVRPHLLPAKQTAVAVNGTTLPRAGSFILDGDAGGPDERVSTGATLRIEDYRMPGAWVLTGSTKIRATDGKPVTTGPAVQNCLEPAQSGFGRVRRVPGRAEPALRREVPARRPVLDVPVGRDRDLPRRGPAARGFLALAHPPQPHLSRRAVGPERPPSGPAPPGDGIGRPRTHAVGPIARAGPRRFSGLLRRRRPRRCRAGAPRRHQRHSCRPNRCPALIP